MALFDAQIKGFIKSVISKYKSLSQSDARICVMRFTSWSELLHPFSALTDINSALAAINDVSFYGKG
jgi:hypothetical protein